MAPKGPKGLYVWGGCGTGKTFLMDLFYDCVPVTQKKRIHFHEWMIDVHDRLHKLQKNKPMIKEKANTVWTAEAAMAQRKELQKGGSSQAAKESADDLVAQVARDMMKEAWLLCFDEFQVTHISDAIIMKRLFGLLFEAGAVVVATSNRPPEDLYLNGLNRPLFLPFIPMLKDFCDVHDIASQVDYRLTGEGEENDKRVYIHPNGLDEAKLLERKFYRLANQQVRSGGQIETQGRRIPVPKSAMSSQVAWFDFKNLCDRPLGAADYLAIAGAFHTVFVANIPALTLQERDQVRRFITMIDAFYERHTKLVCTADRDPITLFTVTEEEKKTSVADEIFAWDRTVSRLIEMQSTKYLSEVVRSMDGDEFLTMFNMKSLSDDDISEMWRRYDRDDSGEIDMSELKHMLEDIMEKHKGHRNVAEEIFEECLETIDTDKNGAISYEEFVVFLSDFTLVSSSLRIGSYYTD
jgi:predicted ATPase